MSENVDEKEDNKRKRRLPTLFRAEQNVRGAAGRVSSEKEIDVALRMTLAKHVEEEEFTSHLNGQLSCSIHCAPCSCPLNVG